MSASTYTALCPDGPIPAPADNPEETAKFAVHQLTGRPGRIVCNARDLNALRCTLLAHRVIAGTARIGYPQAGTLWVEVL